MKMTHSDKPPYNLAIVGCCKNTVAFLPGFRSLVEKIDAAFGPICVCLSENGSTDGTKEWLKAWQSENSTITVLDLDYKIDTSLKRTERLALARNSYIEWLNCLGWAEDAILVVIDLDEVTADPQLAERVIFHIDLLSNSDHEAYFANSKPYYYDIWALREENWCPNDCWSEVDAAVNAGMPRRRAIGRYVRRRQIVIDHESLIPVSSAFNGLGIYRLHSAKASRYCGATVEGRAICEHVPFNLSIKASTHRQFYIAPRLLTSAKETKRSKKRAIFPAAQREPSSAKSRIPITQNPNFLNSSNRAFESGPAQSSSKKSPNVVECHICQGRSPQLFHLTVMGKYFISYFRCCDCGFLQTEDPYWLSDAYHSPINIEDTGIIRRNLALRRIAASVISLGFDRKSAFVDYAGGYGVFVRLMRDLGFNFFWLDEHAENIFARGFQYEISQGKAELVTALECFEHFSDPGKSLEHILTFSDSVLFTTKLIPSDVDSLSSWNYLGVSHGQHVSFYTAKSLRHLGMQYGLYFATNGRNVHLFSRRKETTGILPRALLAARKVPLTRLCVGQKSLTLSDSRWCATIREREIES